MRKRCIPQNFPIALKWPATIPDLNPLDYYLWGVMEPSVDEEFPPIRPKMTRPWSYEFPPTRRLSFCLFCIITVFLIEMWIVINMSAVNNAVNCGNDQKSQRRRITLLTCVASLRTWIDETLIYHICSYLINVQYLTLFYRDLFNSSCLCVCLSKGKQSYLQPTTCELQ